MVKNNESYTSIIIDFLEYCLLFVIIIECNSIFGNSVENGSEDVNKYLTKIANIISFLLCVYYLYGFVNKKSLFISSFPILLFILSYLSVFYYVNVVNVRFLKNEYITHFFVFFSLIYILFKIKRLQNCPFDFFLKYSDIICVLSFISLVAYFSFIFFPENAIRDVVRTRWIGIGEITELYNYLNFCVIAPWDIRSFGNFIITRNYGWYPESPMFCIALVSALYTELFLRKDNFSVSRCFLLVITICSSLATLGMMLAVIGICIKLVDKFKSLIKTRYIVTIVFLALSLCVLLYIQKRSTNTSDLSSYAIHLDDYRVSFLAFLEKPFIGWGYNAPHFIEQFMSAERLVSNKGLSNSIAVIFAEGGIMLGLFCIFPFAVCLMQTFNKNRREIGLWAVGLFGIYCLMIFHFHLYFIMLIAFGYSLLDSNFSIKERLFKISICENDTTVYTENCPSFLSGALNKVLYIKFVLLALILLLFITNKTLWEYLFSFLSSYKLLLGYSVWRTIILIVIGIYFSLLIKYTFFASDKKSFNLWLWRTVRFVFCCLVFCFIYSQIYSFIIDYFSRHNKLLSDAKESTILLIVFVCFVVAVELITFGRKILLTTHSSERKI